MEMHACHMCLALCLHMGEEGWGIGDACMRRNLGIIDDGI